MMKISAKQANLKNNRSLLAPKMIINNHQINADQLLALEQLSLACKESDRSAPNIYPHILTQQRTFAANFLFYDQKQLLGFLGAFFFYDDAVEISLLVHPAYRNKGIARQLLHAVLPLIQFQNYATLIFSCPAELNTKWLLAKNYTYKHSEFYMERDELRPVLESNNNLSFHSATPNEIEALCALDVACFPKKSTNVPNRFHHLFDNRDYQIFLAVHNNQIIGKAHMRWQPQEATLSDIAVTPSQQGKGYGSSLIAHCINLALSEGKPLINLDVETHNQRALNLYTRFNFKIKNACDYWSITTETL